MSEVVVDSSAVLTLLNGELGSEEVEKCFPDVVISSINLAEVVTVYCRNGGQESKARPLLSALFPEVVDFDSEQAYLVASLYKNTSSFGLSLGDRACLALAMQRKAKVITADRAWKKVGVNVDIQVIR